MNRGWRRSLAAWGALATLALSAVPVRADTASSLAQQMQQLNTELQRTQNTLASDRSQLNQALAAAVSWQRKRGLAASQIQEEDQALTALQGQIQQTEQQYGAVTASLEAADQRLAALEVQSDTDLRVLYEGGTVHLLSVLFGSTSFSDFLSRFHFLQEIFASNVTLLREVGAERQAVKAQQAGLQAQRDQLYQLQLQAQGMVTQLEQEQAIYQQASNAAQAQALALAHEIQAEQQAAQQVTSELANLQVQYDRARGQLVFIWPVPAPRYITSPYGPRCIQSLHICDFHTGVDIGKPTGTPIEAALDGVVVAAGWQGGYGQAVIIYHGEWNGHKYYTLYAHQSRIASWVGEKVRQGQIIGYVGMTGFATGPHLHFEIRVDGKPVNPMGYLPNVGVILDY